MAVTTGNPILTQYTYQTDIWYDTSNQSNQAYNSYARNGLSKSLIPTQKTVDTPWTIPSMEAVQGANGNN